MRLKNEFSKFVESALYVSSETLFIWEEYGYIVVSSCVDLDDCVVFGKIMITTIVTFLNFFKLLISYFES